MLLQTSVSNRRDHLCGRGRGTHITQTNATPPSCHHLPARRETTIGCAFGLVNCDRLVRGCTRWAGSTYWHTSCRVFPAIGAIPASFEVMGSAGRTLGSTGDRWSPSNGTRRLNDCRAWRLTFTLESVNRGVKASKICRGEGGHTHMEDTPI